MKKTLQSRAFMFIIVLIINSGGKCDKETKSLYICPAFLILPKERVVFKTHPHWLFVVVPEVALLALGILLIEYLPFFLIDQILPLRWVLVLLGGAWCFVMTIIFLDWICTNYYLTNLIV